MAQNAIPHPLISRRMHSITGIWLTIFLMQHLLINSQAAYFFGEDGKGFIHAVNSIHELPYLPVIEILILGFPIFVHMILGIKYLYTAKFNSFGKTYKAPSLPQYSRNKAYTWQRLTSYFLIFAIIAHVVQMRFIEYPSNAAVGSEEYFMVLVNLDEGIYTLAERLDVQLYDSNKILIQRKLASNKEFENTSYFQSFVESMKGIYQGTKTVALPKLEINELVEKQKIEENENFLKTLEKHKLTNTQAVAVAKDFGTAELLMVRETFKIPIMVALYTVFVIGACFHAFNGLWTFLISWGVTLTKKTQDLFLKISYGLMFIFSFLGLSAIYATYWINLKQ